MPQQQQPTRPTSPSQSASTPHPQRPAPQASSLEELAPDTEVQTSDEPSIEELRAAYAEMQRQRQAGFVQPEPVPTVSKPKPAKAPDPFEPDDLVTLLIPSIIRGVIEGIEAKDDRGETHRIYYSKGRREYIAAERPGTPDEDTGKPGPGMAVTLTFIGGVCREIPYSVAKALKKARQYRSNDALKVVPSDTPETEYAKLCGVQPMQPNKMAALLLASDLDEVLAGFTTEQLTTFTAALKRRAEANAAHATADGQKAGILNTSSWQRG